jgi:hypothetical protein
VHDVWVLRPLPDRLTEPAGHGAVGRPLYKLEGKWAADAIAHEEKLPDALDLTVEVVDGIAASIALSGGDHHSRRREGYVSQTLSNARAPDKLLLYHPFPWLTDACPLDGAQRDTLSGAGP